MRILSATGGNRPTDFSGQDDAIWWLGHACILMRVAGHHLLIDPALGKRASPVPFAGPGHKTPLPASIEELLPIDVVLYSHNIMIIWIAQRCGGCSNALPL